MAEFGRSFLELLGKYPELATVVFTLLVWPTITGLASLGYHKLEQRAPNVVAYLRASGFDLPRALEALRGVLSKKLPPPPGAGAAVLLCLVLGGSAVGCAGQQIDQLQRYAEAARDVAAAAEPCLVAQQEAATKACAGDVACESKVKQLFAPVADALDLIHATWCHLSPASEGCS